MYNEIDGNGRRDMDKVKNVTKFFVCENIIILKLLLDSDFSNGLVVLTAIGKESLLLFCVFLGDI